MREREKERLRKEKEEKEREMLRQKLKREANISAGKTIAPIVQPLPLDDINYPDPLFEKPQDIIANPLPISPLPFIKPDVVPRPDMPSAYKPDIPNIPKIDLPPKPDTPTAPKPEIPTAPKPEMPAKIEPIPAKLDIPRYDNCNRFDEND